MEEFSEGHGACLKVRPPPSCSRAQATCAVLYNRHTQSHVFLKIMRIRFILDMHVLNMHIDLFWRTGACPLASHDAPPHVPRMQILHSHMPICFSYMSTHIFLDRNARACFMACPCMHASCLHFLKGGARACCHCEDTEPCMHVAALWSESKLW